MYVDGLAIAVEVAPPHLLDQALARVHAVGMREQIGQQVELLGCEAHLVLADVHGARAPVETETVELLDIGGLAALLAAELDAAQQRVDACHQLGEREGLGDVVVGADVEADHLVDLRTLGGEHEDGRRHLLSQDAADLEPAELGQHQVEQDEVGTDAARLGERLRPGPRLADLVPLLDEVVAQRLADVGLVLDHEDAFGHQRFRACVSAMPVATALMVRVASPWAGYQTLNGRLTELRPPR